MSSCLNHFILFYFFAFFHYISDTEEFGDEKLLSLLKRDQNVKDLKQKLINIQQNPSDTTTSCCATENEKSNSIEDLSGLISKAKGELERNRQKSCVRDPVESEIKQQELEQTAKKSEIEMHWEELIENMDRPLILNDLDFTDLTENDDLNIFAILPKKGIIPPPPMSWLTNPRNSLNLQSVPDSNNLVSSSKAHEFISKKSKKTVRNWNRWMKERQPSTFHS